MAIEPAQVDRLRGAAPGTADPLQKYESGKNSLRPERMLRIAEAFDISVLQLFDGTGSGKRRKA